MSRTPSCAASTASATTGRRRLTLAQARANRAAPRLGATRPPQPTFPARARCPTYRLDELVELHRLDALLRRLGAARALPGDPADATRGRAAREPVRRRPAHARARRRRAAAAAPAAWSASGRPARPHDDDIVLFTDESRTTELDRLHTLRQQMAKPDGRPNVCPGRLLRPGRIAGVRRLRRRLRGDRRRRAGRGQDAFRRSRRRLLGDPARPRSPTGWPRRPPSGCTPACGASCGATRRTRRSTTPPDPRGVPGHPAGAGLPGLPDHTEKRTIFRLLDAERRPACT